MNYRKLIALSTLFLLLFTILPTFAQNATDSTTKVPALQLKGFYKYMAANVKYPGKAILQNVQGTSIFLLKVEHGQIQYVETALNLEGLSENVKTLISTYTELPKTMNGKYSLGVKFIIGNGSNTEFDEKAIIPADYVKLPNVTIMTSSPPRTLTAPDINTYGIEEVDTPPNFPGGYQALQEYFYKTIKYPAEALKNKVEGRIYFSFKIDYDGNVKNVKVLRGLGAGLDEVAKDAMKDCPKWNAAIKNGQTVSTKFSYFAECRLPNP
ncbi:energy transducer TonB [Pedobacter sp. HDW13]|uniref:energy transducer TonB n=1 Tax=Pedobacter sp. HDW13 TaxID=2714940 RepID=UPI00140740CF|nr:energy transducer TonB [Pedobacter sp. HDW13]QIL40893.1 energy transducer TonB [Pedobacter sp. HDW13]